MSERINSEEAYERFFKSLKILNRPPRLSNLPNAVIQKVIKKCELRDLLALRNVSKHFREIVDTRVKYNGIKVSCRRDHVLLELRYRGRFSRNVVYAGVDWNSEVVFSNINYKSEYTPDRTVAISVGKQCELIKSEDYEKMAFDDLAIVLKNPKIEVGCFIFEYYVDNENLPITVQDIESSKRFYEKMRALLGSLNHKLLVRRVKLVVEDPDGVLAILPYLKPVFLQEIEINSEVSTNSWQNQEKIERIVNLEQWMKAKDILKTRNTFEFFPTEHLMNFERFRIYQSFVDTGFLLKLRELFSKSPNLGKCYIDSRDKFDAEVLAEHVGEPALSTQWSSNVRRYQLPDTDEFLQFQFHGGAISIRRYPNNISLNI